MLHHGNCLDIFKKINNETIDLILTDPPYGSTACKWDCVIPLEEMWDGLKRIRKKNSTTLLFGSEPFSSKLRMSNIKEFKYDWIWHKNLSTNFLHAKHQPLRNIEIIHVFYKKLGKFNPIKSTGHKPTQSAKGSSPRRLWYGKENIRNESGGCTERNPTQYLNFKVVDPKLRLHSSQKPIQLLEYLIRTYTNEGDIVLDFAMGSGSTGVACKNLNRKFIGIEKEKLYFDIAKKRYYDINNT